MNAGIEVHRSSPIQGEFMKSSSVLIAAILSSLAFSAQAEQVPVGVWLQTSSTAGDCADCQITVSKPTPQIIQIESNNGWKGYAHYSAKADRYEGAVQWAAGQGGDYENVVLLIQVTYVGSTLSLRAESQALSFSSTYRKK